MIGRAGRGVSLIVNTQRRSNIHAKWTADTKSAKPGIAAM
jgi:hypothetical protein